MTCKNMQQHVLEIAVFPAISASLLVLRTVNYMNRVLLARVLANLGITLDLAQSRGSEFKIPCFPI